MRRKQMNPDIRFQLKVAVETKALTPVTVSDELKSDFLKKVRIYPWKYLPFSILAFLIVFYLLIMIKLRYEAYFYPVLSVGVVIILASLISPFFLVYNIFTSTIGILRKDYEFYEGEIVSIVNRGYEIKGLKGHEIRPLIGRHDYEIGERVIIARVGRDFYLISE